MTLFTAGDSAYVTKLVYACIDQCCKLHYYTLHFSHSCLGNEDNDANVQAHVLLRLSADGRVIRGLECKMECIIMFIWNELEWHLWKMYAEYTDIHNYVHVSL